MNPMRKEGRSWYNSFLDNVEKIKKFVPKR
jgi:hypothetical protein